MGKLQQIIRSEIAKNFSLLFAANVFAQVVGLLVYPILSRQYLEEDFGLLSLFLSINGIMTILATAEYQYAILLPKEDKRARACFHVGALVMLCIFAVSWLLIPQPVSHRICNIFGTPELEPYLWLLPLFMLISALWILTNYWFTRCKRFRNVSIYQITQSLVSAGSKVGLGALGVSGGLIWSCVIAPVVAYVVSIFAGARDLMCQLLHIDKEEMRLAAREYDKFPKFSLPRALVNNVSGNLPALLLTPFFGLGEVGFFGMAMSLSFRPINMVCDSLYQVFFQHISQRVQKGETIRHFVTNFIGKTLLILVPCLTIGWFILPPLVEWFLGDSWTRTAELIRYMLPWLLLTCLGSPLCFISDVFNQQKVGMFIEWGYCALRVLALMVGVWMQSFTVAIIGYSAVGTIVISGQLCWYMSLIRRYEKSIA